MSSGSSQPLLTPLKKPTADCWFSRTPIGHNTLKNYVGNMCKKAGIPGFKTNHSLRATAATRLYLNGVDEQLVMERTGHRSIEGIRSYKRTSREQQENVSDLLNGKKPCLVPVPSSTSHPQCVTANICAPQNSSTSTDHTGAFYLHSCSNVTINFNHNPKP